MFLKLKIFSNFRALNSGLEMSVDLSESLQLECVKKILR